MAKKAEPILRSIEESDSDASSSSSEEEGSPPAPSLATTDKKSADLKTMCSGSESDDFDRPLNSIVSKPMDNGLRLKRPRSRPNSRPNSAASQMKTPASQKKSVLFQRLWSDDDEIAILKGMLDYKEEKGLDPMWDANDFHDFIKKLVHVDVDRKQLVDKVRRLKKRFRNSMNKRKTFNPHETIVLELSKKVWGQKMESKGAGNAEMKSPARNRSSATYDVKKEADEGEKVGNPAQFLGKASVFMGMDESIVNMGLELCEEDKKAEIEEKWRKLHLQASDLFVRKLDLARQESEMIIAALRSS